MYSLSEIAFGLIYKQWYKGYLTFSFREEPLSYESQDEIDSFVQMPTSAKNAVFNIMEYIESVVGIHLTYTTGVGDIVIGTRVMNENTLGYSYMPGSSANTSTGDIYLNSQFNNLDYQLGGMGYSTIIHELGHALGLEHPFGDAYSVGVDISTSIMSYNSFSGYCVICDEDIEINSYTSFSVADIMALQSMYGVGSNSYQHNIYDMSIILSKESITTDYIGEISTNKHTIFDNGGLDTIDLSEIDNKDGNFIDLRGDIESVISNKDMLHAVSIYGDIENLIGTNGSDIVYLNNASNIIDLKDGYDSVYISDINNARIDNLNGKTVISSLDGGLDVIVNVENIFLNDELLNLDLYQRMFLNVYDTPKAFEIGRLYLSVFDRVADKDGLLYWINDYYTNGNSLKNIASSFILSDEFINTYGSSVQNSEYIELLYNNVLYRKSDTDGMNYWLDEMANGFGKGEVLISFANSDEFINLTSVYFDGGIWVA